jgi:hypothetical protein
VYGGNIYIQTHNPTLGGSVKYIYNTALMILVFVHEDTDSCTTSIRNISVMHELHHSSTNNNESVPVVNDKSVVVHELYVR